MVKVVKAVGVLMEIEVMAMLVIVVMVVVVVGGGDSGGFMVAAVVTTVAYVRHSSRWSITKFNILLFIYLFIYLAHNAC